MDILACRRAWSGEFDWKPIDPASSWLWLREVPRCTVSPSPPAWSNTLVLESCSIAEVDVQLDTKPQQFVAETPSWPPCIRTWRKASLMSIDTVRSWSLMAVLTDDCVSIQKCDKTMWRFKAERSKRNVDLLFSTGPESANCRSMLLFLVWNAMHECVGELRSLVEKTGPPFLRQWMKHCSCLASSTTKPARNDPT